MTKQEYDAYIVRMKEFSSEWEMAEDIPSWKDIQRFEQDEAISTHSYCKNLGAIALSIYSKLQFDDVACFTNDAIDVRVLPLISPNNWGESWEVDKSSGISELVLGYAIRVFYKGTNSEYLMIHEDSGIYDRIKNCLRKENLDNPSSISKDFIEGLMEFTNEEVVEICDIVDFAISRGRLSA